MTDRKLTEAEMISYLELSVAIGNTVRLAPEEAKTLLDLINRQKAEIDRLQKHNTEYARKHYQDGRAEAVKEFEERLKNDSCNIVECNGTTKRVVSYQITPSGVDKIVRELTNEN